MSDDRPSIAELHHSHPARSDAAILDAAPVLLEIAVAALSLGPELVYLSGPLSERLRVALARGRP